MLPKNSPSDFDEKRFCLRPIVTHPSFSKTNIVIHERKALWDWQTEPGLDVLPNTPAALCCCGCAWEMQTEHDDDPQDNKGCEQPLKDSQSST